MKCYTASSILRCVTLLAGSIGLAWLAACSNPGVTSPAPQTPAQIEAVPTEPATPTKVTSQLNPTAAPTPEQVVQENDPSGGAGPAATARPQYLLEALLDYDRHSLAVQETITYTNRTETPLVDLLLVIEPLNYLNMFKLNTITWGDGAPVESIQWDGHLARIPLSQPLAAGQPIQLTLDYQINLPDSTAFPPDTRPVPFGFSQRQANLVDWYPYLAVYDAERGWQAHPPSYYGEHQIYETSDVEVRLQVNSSLPEITVAASAPDLAAPDLPAQDMAEEKAPAGTRAHHYRAENVRSFALSASHQYQVFRQELGGITLLSYTFPYHAAAGERALQVTAQSVALYQELFGDYPHPVLSVVEADFLDGMEYDGLYFLSNGFYNLYAGSPAEYLTAIAAHETAHQWWYGIVGNDQAYEPWLDEALSTYCERLYYERYYPEALDWWWTYRVNYYQPTGWINTTIYNPEGSNAPYRYYRNAVYLNGALFFEDLRTLIGDQTFFAFLKSYANENRGKIVTQEDFFQLLDQFTSQDISGLTQKYFKFN
jgi:hypothetical protein